MNALTKEEIIKKIQEKQITNAYVLAYFYNKVCVGLFKENTILFHQEVQFDYLTQIRIFNPQMELKYIWDEDKHEFLYSEIIDKEDLDLNDYFDEEMFVTGNQIVDSDENFTTITQLNRIVDLPLKVTKEEVKKGIRLVVRNYFEITEDEQVILGKSRLVEFKKEAK